MKEKGYYDGIYRKNPKGFGFIKLEEQKDEIYISKENSLNALNGDRVLIEIIKQESREKSAEAKVIKILKHEKDTIVGIFQNSKNYGFVVPDDRNFGTDILYLRKIREKQKIIIKF